MSNSSSMQWASALSTRPFLEAAITEAVEQAVAALQASWSGVGGDSEPRELERPIPNVGFLFVSSAFASEYTRVLPLVQAKLAEAQIPAIPIVGCNGGGIIGINTRGTAREVEDEAAVSLVLAVLPQVKVHPFYINPEQLPDLDGPPSVWSELIGVDPQEIPQFIILADPFSSGINNLLSGLDYAYSECPKVGGIASSGVMNGQSGLFCGDRFYREGVVGVALSGNIVMDTIVAQGCRPIGSPFQVLESERNVILKMQASDQDRSSSNGSPLEMLRDLIQWLSEEDKVLAQTALFVGVAQSEFKQVLEPGDFLIRNLLGFDPRVGALAIGDRIRAGQRIQFHLRDAATSQEDLETLLRRYQYPALEVDAKSVPKGEPKGALMFACLGRGEALYGEPNFDSQLFSRYCNHIPMGGFFCNGEIGPVGANTYLHGFTASFGIFRPREAQG
ncbi:MAG: FIST N-terminal domain-containing protein [Synechococcales bacterium]|nr:FIST N-terminal domain-containing protein [Synechococcales bacterium]